MGGVLQFHSLQILLVVLGLVYVLWIYRVRRVWGLDVEMLMVLVMGCYVFVIMVCVLILLRGWLHVISQHTAF